MVVRRIYSGNLGDIRYTVQVWLRPKERVEFESHGERIATAWTEDKVIGRLDRKMLAEKNNPLTAMRSC